ncbi:PREDICTED: putative invertase inhibitor [Camelina sativa]|uniref:Invertase inhibitor n=1 Tax=Camelina sativa TaxID=90675 RepID=A0ABM0Y3K4_CAMSA|nr:PREDICTED: putative invertase inhibitor [Camelina sativa]
MKYLLYLIVTFFLLLNGFSTAQTLIRDSCKKAAAKNPKFKNDICVKSLETNPQSKAAKDLAGLVVASTKNAASKATSLKGTVDKILKGKKMNKMSEMALRDCLQLYTDAIDSLNQALASVKSRDYNTVATVLSAAMDAPSTCETGFKEIKTPQKSPVTKDNDTLYQMILIPLSFTNMLK